MNSKNDYIRHYLGVDVWHSAGYTGRNGLTLTAEEDDTKTNDGHGHNTLMAFLEIAPDRKVEYLDFTSNDISGFCSKAELSGADTMYMSISGTIPNSSERNKLENLLPKTLSFFASAGNHGMSDYNNYTRSSNIYGVAAASLVGDGWTVNGVKATNEKPILMIESYSSESEYVDFTSITDLVVINGAYKFGGTSCSCPVLCGMAALINDFFISKTGKPLSSSMMYQFLKDCSDDLNSEGRDDKTGWGIPRLPHFDTIDIKKYQPEYSEEHMTAVDKLLSIASAEEGYLEKASNSNLDSKTANAGNANYTKYARDLDSLGVYNGKKNGYAWCDIFVDWCFIKAFGLEVAMKMTGQPMGGLGAGCTFSARYYKNMGRFITSNPKSGDQIFFTEDVGSTFYHTGIVEKVSGGKVYTIEGNTSSAQGVVANGGCVRKKSYSLTYSKIGGYGRPDYSIIKEDDDDMITLEQFTELMNEFRSTLRDNDSSSYSEEARKWSVNTGIIEGGDPDKFNGMWEDFLTREQLVTVLYRFAKYIGKA